MLQYIGSPAITTRSSRGGSPFVKQTKQLGLGSQPMVYQLYRSDSTDCWDTVNDEMVAVAYCKILPQAAENHRKFSVRITGLWTDIQI
jgi:hypothetical protein